MACSDILWMRAWGVLLIAFTATWTERAYLALSIDGNLCTFTICIRHVHSWRDKPLLLSLFTRHSEILLYPIGDSSGWTPRGRHTGDHPWHEPRSGLFRHGGQCGGGRSEVYPCRGWLHHCWTVSHTNRTSASIFLLKLLEKFKSYWSYFWLKTTHNSNGNSIHSYSIR